MANERRICGNTRSFKSGRGFTMIEILVVIGIILIIVTLLVGGYADLLQARRLGHSVERVVNTISYARNLAIQDKAITHVRIENRGPNDQWVGVYRFPKISDAIAATTEKSVQDKGGWNAPLVKQLDKQKLEINVYFETQYDPNDPNGLWNDARNRPRPLEYIHPSQNNLYYSGLWSTANTNNPYTVYLPDAGGDAINLLPKQATYTSGGAGLSGAATHLLLAFNPDGSATANVLLFIRDNEMLRWVQVWRGGMVRTGDISKRTHFDALK
ncbi:MAG: prepilin-type N-terminal cleavage/methylation domain-containing protein [Planctomycetes bacterium]|nr:prepilin-type N-terminal cleavage/methylation domain-containing protein [Planctomycetota bacterium]